MIRDLLGLLDQSGRRSYYALLVFSVISSLLQTAGVAAISLFFTLLLGGSLPGTVQSWTQEWSFESQGAITLVLMFLGTGSSAWTTYWGVKLSWDQYQKIATKLLRRFIDNRYEWHLQQNSANLVTLVVGETQVIVNSILQQLVLVVVRGFEICFIAALLVATRPMIAVVSVVSFATVYSVIYFVNRNFVHAMGTLAERSSSQRYKTAAEALAGIKEVKVANTEEHFVRQFVRSASDFSRGYAGITYFSMMPKYFIEFILFGGVIGFVVVAHSRGWNINESIPLLALYGAAAIRLLPAAQQLYYSSTTILAAKASFASVMRSLEDEGPSRAEFVFDPEMEPLIRLENVSFQHRGANRLSLDGVDLSVMPGEKLGVVGRTGAGKTTLVDILLGLLPPSQGRVLVKTVPSSATFVSYVPQRLHFIDDSIAANIALGEGDGRDLLRVESAAKEAHIHDHISGLPESYDTLIGEQAGRLSGGQRQRIGIARALYRHPHLLILDEASNALDFETETKIVDSLLEQQMTVVIIAHRLSILKRCDRIIILDNGSIRAVGTFSELFASDPIFQRLASSEDIDAK